MGEDMNNIFLKNLEALSKKNLELCKRLQAFIPSELPKLVQTNGAYNILYKNIYYLVMNMRNAYWSKYWK